MWIHLQTPCQIFVKSNRRNQWNLFFLFCFGNPKIVCYCHQLVSSVFVWSKHLKTQGLLLLLLQSVFSDSLCFSAADHMVLFLLSDCCGRFKKWFALQRLLSWAVIAHRRPYVACRTPLSCVSCLPLHSHCAIKARHAKKSIFLKSDLIECNLIAHNSFYKSTVLHWLSCLTTGKEQD